MERSKGDQLTRQQEGDEARSGFICGAWTIREQGPILNYEQPYIRAQYVYRCDSDAGHEGDHADSVLLTNWRGPTPEDAAKAKLPTPEETTLPEPESYRYKTSEEAAMLPLPLQLLRLKGINEQLCHSFNTLLISNSRLEAERDDLKANRDMWRKRYEDSIAIQRHRDAWRRYAYGKSPRPTDFLDSSPSSEPTRIEQLQAQIDAVVGQETPQDAWERGYDAGTMAAHNWIEDEDEDTPQQEVVEGIRKAIICMTPPPYTPPLKAGQ